MSDGTELPCIVFVELVTDYLEGVLSPVEYERVDAHLAICPHCVTVLEQWRGVIHLAGRLQVDHVDRLDAAVRDDLLAAFRAVRSPVREQE